MTPKPHAFIAKKHIYNHVFIHLHKDEFYCKSGKPYYHVVIVPCLVFGTFRPTLTHQRYQTTFPETKVEWPMSEHWSIQGKSNSRGKLRYFRCPKKTWMPPLGTFDALKIVKNGLDMKLLWLPKVEGVKNSTKTNHQTLQKRFSNTQKNPCMLIFRYWNSKMICRTVGGAPITL